MLLNNVKCFNGVYSRNQLPNKLKGFKTIICNTDPSYAPGEHWVAIVINSDGTGDYFDSYGLPPLHNEFKKFLHINCPNGWFHNPITLQCLSCVTCGHYCVAYIKMRCSGKSYCDFISLFTSNLVSNENIVKSLIHV